MEPKRTRSYCGCILVVPANYDLLFPRLTTMSALPPEADIAELQADVR